jgi:hypothetical protein
MAAPLTRAEDYGVGRCSNAGDSLSTMSEGQDKSRKVHLEFWFLSSRLLYRFAKLNLFELSQSA